MNDPYAKSFLNVSFSFQLFLVTIFSSVTQQEITGKPVGCHTGDIVNS